MASYVLTNGNDSIVGTAGDDVFEGNPYTSAGRTGGNDTLDGGGGDDLFVYVGGLGGTIEGGSGVDTVRIDYQIGAFNSFGNSTFSGVEVLDIVSLEDPNSVDISLAQLASFQTITNSAGEMVCLQISDAGGAFDFSTRVPEGKGLQLSFSWRSTAGFNVTGTQEADVLIGSSFDDRIYGGDGDDTIDSVFMGSGSPDGIDRFFGGLGNDWLIGGYQNDFLDGGDGADTIKGSGGDDFLVGNGGSDMVRGGEGNDLIFAGAGDQGDDELFGENGDDQVGGGAGDDTIRGDSGKDTLFGGTGDDFLWAAIDDSSFPWDGGVIWAGSGHDQAFGDGGNDVMGGGLDNDIMSGAGGDDRIYGSAGNDQIDGMAGSDTVFGGAGNDTISGGDGDDTLYSGGGNDLFSGGAGADTFFFARSTGNSRIQDFQNGDWIDLSSFEIGASALNIATSGPTVTITLDGVADFSIVVDHGAGLVGIEDFIL